MKEESIRELSCFQQYACCKSEQQGILDENLLKPVL